MFRKTLLLLIGQLLFTFCLLFSYVIFSLIEKTNNRVIIEPEANDVPDKQEMLLNETASSIEGE